MIPIAKEPKYKGTKNKKKHKNNEVFDHQFIETEKYEAKPTYKKFFGYRPGVAGIGDLIVGIEECG